MSTIITKKQFPNYRKYTMDLAGRPLTLEVGGENGVVRFSGKSVTKSTKETKGFVEVELEPALPSPLVQFCTVRLRQLTS